MRILFLADGPRSPLVTGDRLRNWRLVERLALRHEVHWWAFEEEGGLPEFGDPPAGVAHRNIRVPRGWEVRSDKIRKWLKVPFTSDPSLVLTPPSPRLVKLLREAARGFDVIHVSHLLLWRMMPPELAPRCVVDLCDSMSLRYRSYLDMNGGSSGGDRGLLWYRMFGQASKLHRYEAAMPDKAGAALVVAARDRDYLDSPRMEVVPNGVDLDYYRSPGAPRTPGRIIFFGNLSYRPSVDAARLLAREILPRVAAQLPGAHLRLVGAHPSEAVRELEGLPGVTLVGWVEDLREELSRAEVFACPLRVASGMQNKVLEALAMELPTVASPNTAAGLELEAGRHFLVAEPGENFVRDVLRLLREPELRGSLAREGRAAVESRYSWDRAVAQLEGIYARVAVEASL